MSRKTLPYPTENARQKKQINQYNLFFDAKHRVRKFSGFPPPNTRNIIQYYVFIVVKHRNYKFTPTYPLDLKNCKETAVIVNVLSL